MAKQSVGNPRRYSAVTTLRLDETTAAWVKLMADYFKVGEAEFISTALNALRELPTGQDMTEVATVAAAKKTAQVSITALAHKKKEH